MINQPFKVKTVWLDSPQTSRDEQLNLLVKELQSSGHSIIDIKFAASNFELYVLILYCELPHE